MEFSADFLNRFPRILPGFSISRGKPLLDHAPCFFIDRRRCAGPRGNVGATHRPILPRSHSKLNPARCASTTTAFLYIIDAYALEDGRNRSVAFQNADYCESLQTPSSRAAGRLAHCRFPRRLLELSVWSRYVFSSDENARRFYDDLIGGYSRGYPFTSE
jgi:hypothetical protein